MNDVIFIRNIMKYLLKNILTITVKDRRCKITAPNNT